MSSFMYKMRKLKNMPLDLAVKKAGRKAIRTLVYTIRKYRIQAVPIPLDTARFTGFNSGSRFLFHPEDRQRYKDHLVELGRDTGIIEDAGRICSHNFNLLGSGDIGLGGSLPWNEDFKVKYRWKNSFYKQMKIIDLDHPADVKVPWELSRFQHVFTLGKAYWLTGEEQYAREFRDQLEDWLARNPIEMSVNWTCTMDVAIRAVNWISGAWFFWDSPCLEEDFWARFHASLYQHGQFIMNNLENEGEHTGNHYLCNLSGLIALGIYFRDSKAVSDRRGRHSPEIWLSFGLEEFEREMLVQVNEDGTNYEASTSYHRLVTECFLVTTALCSRNGIGFSQVYMNRLEKMCRFLLDIAKPDGCSPLIGDADDGRLLIPADYGSWVRHDFRHLLAVAGELFDRDDYRHAGRDFQEDALWIAGTFKVAEPRGGEGRLRSTAYPDGGYYVLRQGPAYCLVRCGDLSFHGQGAHSHNDQLSFELQIGGHDIIVDPGSYVYTADYRMRNLFRSTGMHNTLEVDGKEQNEFEARNLFEMKEQTFSRCDGFRDGFFAGSHQGYLRKCGVIHRRELTLSGHRLEIIDKLECAGDTLQTVPVYAASFIIAPGVKAEKQLNGRFVLHRQGIILEITFLNAEDAECHPCWVSRRYGEREESRLIRVRGRNSNLHTVIEWSIHGKEGFQ